MPSIPYLLMTEYYTEHKLAQEKEQWDRSFVFSSAEGTVNNFLHGRSANECFQFVKLAFQNLLKELDLSAEEALAYNDAILILDMMAEEYHILM